MLAEVYKCKLHLARNFNVHLARDANAPRLRNRFEASSNVDAIAVDAGAVENNVTLIDPNAEVYAAGSFYASITPCHRAGLPPRTRLHSGRCRTLRGSHRRPCQWCGPRAL